MTDCVVRNNGSLLKKYRPAIYLDANFLIDYWISEGYQGPTDPHEILVQQSTSNKISELLRNFLNSEKDILGALKIRERTYDIVFGGARANAHLVVSPLAIHELMAWNARHTFKYLAVESSGTPIMERKSTKDIGSLLGRLLELRRSEMKETGEDFLVAPFSKTPLQILMSDLFLNPRYAQAHGFQGLLLAPLKSFQLNVGDAWNIGMLMSYLQVQLGDALHILAAKHLGCDFIASRDEDFKRAKPAIEELEMQLLTSTEMILQKL